MWQALTDPDKLEAWFMANDFKPVIDRTFEFHRTANCDLHFSDRIRCRVLEIRDEQLLSYTWTDAQYEGELGLRRHLDAARKGRGTRLFVEHRGFVADDVIQRAARSLMERGWHVYVADRLAAFLGTSHTPSTKMTS